MRNASKVLLHLLPSPEFDANELDRLPSCQVFGKNVADPRCEPFDLVEFWFQGCCLTSLQTSRERASWYDNGVGKLYDIREVLGFGESELLAVEIADSEGKAVSVPQGFRSAVGAKRRWHSDGLPSDRIPQGE